MVIDKSDTMYRYIGVVDDYGDMYVIGESSAWAIKGKS